MTTYQFFALILFSAFVILLTFFCLWFIKRRLGKNRNLDNKSLPFSGKPIGPYFGYSISCFISAWSCVYLLGKDPDYEYPKVVAGTITFVILVLIVIAGYFVHRRLMPMYNRLKAIRRGEITR